MDDKLLWVLVCVSIPLFGVLIFLWGLRSERREKAKAREDAAAQYQGALAKLRDAPADEAAMQETLRLGKTYVDLVRFDKNKSFDEVALMNDLNAVQPASTSLDSIAEATAEPADPDSAVSRLAKLREKRAKGLLTDAEYHEKQLAILDEI